MQANNESNYMDAKRAEVLQAATLRSLARMVGVELTDERIDALLPQAESHLALMQIVAALDPRSAEPAAELRLDWDEVRTND